MSNAVAPKVQQLGEAIARVLTLRQMLHHIRTGHGWESTMTSWSLSRAEVGEGLSLAVVIALSN